MDRDVYLNNANVNDNKTFSDRRLDKNRKEEGRRKGCGQEQKHIFPVDG